MENVGAGFFLLISAGMINGGFTLPMKFTRLWSWENTWFVFSIFGLVIFPPLCTLLTVPNLQQIYVQAGLGPILMVMMFGAIWGVAQVLLGLAVQAVGMSLAFAIILGICAAVGSLIPLLRLHPDKILSPAGLGVMAGVILIIVGVGLCGLAGRLREASISSASIAKNRSFSWGLLLCIISGLTAAAINFGLAFGQQLVHAALAQGSSPVWAPNAVWLPLMIAGALPNLLYCVYLLRKNKSGDAFSRPHTGGYYLLSFVMALCWFGSTLMYGMAVQKMGIWGPILGWPVFMALILITAGVLGVLAGEWKHAATRALRVQMAGVAVLILAVFALALASRRI